MFILDSIQQRVYIWLQVRQIHRKGKNMFNESDSKKVERITKELARYRALVASHTASGNERGIRLAGVMVSRRETTQFRVASRLNLTANQADHLYA